MKAIAKFDLFPFDLDSEFSPETQSSDIIYLKGNEKKIDFNYRYIWRFKIDRYKQSVNTMLNLKIQSKSGDMLIERKIDFTKEIEKCI